MLSRRPRHRHPDGVANRARLPRAAVIAAVLTLSVVSGTPAYAGDTSGSEPPGDVALTLSHSPEPASLGETFEVIATVDNEWAESISRAEVEIEIVGGRFSFLDQYGPGCTPVTSDAFQMRVSCTTGALSAAGGASSRRLGFALEPQQRGTVYIDGNVTGYSNGEDMPITAVNDLDRADNASSDTVTMVNGLGCTTAGTFAADKLTGTQFRDVFCALGGNDTVFAASGGDVLYGGTGDDTLRGARGADTLQGGFGNDSYYGGEGRDTLTDDKGDDVLRGAGGADTLHAADATSGDTVDGGAGIDDCSADAGDIVLNCE